MILYSCNPLHCTVFCPLSVTCILLHPSMCLCISWVSRGTSKLNPYGEKKNAAKSTKRNYALLFMSLPGLDRSRPRLWFTNTPDRHRCYRPVHIVVVIVAARCPRRTAPVHHLQVVILHPCCSSGVFAGLGASLTGRRRDWWDGRQRTAHGVARTSRQGDH